MDRNKRRWLVGGAGAAALAGLVAYASAEPEPEPRRQAKSVEEERIEGLVDLMATNSMAPVESTALRPPPPVAMPVPEGEAFDIGGAVTRHRRAAEEADALDYYDCDGDCTGQGVGITMDGGSGPVPGDEFGASGAETRSGGATAPSPEEPAADAIGADPGL